MGARHSGREAALQMLFQMEGSAATAAQASALYWRNFDEAEPAGRAYADDAVVGVETNLATIDEQIRKASTHWRLERMARVDRNVIRLAAWELAHRPDVPVAVILDEAVELAKAYGTEDSGSFVNGVLAQIAAALGRKDEPVKPAS